MSEVSNRGVDALLSNATYGEITSVTRDIQLSRGSGCTRRVALASIFFDSMNAKSAQSFQFKSKFD